MPEPLITPLQAALGRRGRVPTAFRPSRGNRQLGIQGTGAPRRARNAGARTGGNSRTSGRPPANAGRLRGAANRTPSTRNPRNTLNRNSRPSGSDRRTGRS